MENNWLQIVFPVAMLVLNLFIGIVVSILAFFFHRYFGQQDEKLRDQDRKIEKVGDDLSDFKAAAPETFVLRDDYILKMSGVDNRISSMGEKVGEVQGYMRRGGRE